MSADSEQCIEQGVEILVWNLSICAVNVSMWILKQILKSTGIQCKENKMWVM